jgi:hypothetical protein
VPLYFSWTGVYFPLDDIYRLSRYPCIGTILETGALPPVHHLRPCHKIAASPSCVAPKMEMKELHPVRPSRDPLISYNGFAFTRFLWFYLSWSRCAPLPAPLGRTQMHMAHRRYPRLLPAGILPLGDGTSESVSASAVRHRIGEERAWRRANAGMKMEDRWGPRSSVPHPRAGDEL